jgi:hypothetical protein
MRWQPGRKCPRKVIEDGRISQLPVSRLGSLRYFRQASGTTVNRELRLLRSAAGTYHRKSSTERLSGEPPSFWGKLQPYGDRWPT